ncbi:MAG TPA: hypothetical protein VJ476_10255 [Rhizomicrobium sp.]|nr:hypothetical protein [Rhizomicrobium sp.]
MTELRNPELFGYIAAFVTIVLAIALSDLLMSLHRLIVARRRVTWSSVPLLAAGYVFLLVLSEFFSIWAHANVAQIPFFYLVLLVSVSSTGALAAFAVLPDEVPERGLDMWQTYLENRGYLFGILIISFIGDSVRAQAHLFLIHRSVVLGLTAWLVFWALDLVSVGLFALLAWTANKRVHVAGLLALYGIAAYGFGAWTVGAP